MPAKIAPWTHFERSPKVRKRRWNASLQHRTNPRYSGDSIQRSWTSLLAERMQWTAARKSTALKTDFGTKTSRIAALIAPGRVATLRPFPSPPPHFATFPLGLSCEGMGERDANALGGLDNLFGSERPAGRAERRPRQTKKHLQSQEAHE